MYKQERYIRKLMEAGYTYKAACKIVYKPQESKSNEYCCYSLAA